jgi:predicted metalloprotease with PDZ domain
LLGKTVTRVLRGKGRFKQSLAESSFDAWIKYYRQDENTPNAVVSYYTKGSLVAAALDVTIRDATNDAKSLDDVMRALWQRHGKTGVGVPEAGVEAIASEVAGLDLAPFFDEYIRGTPDVPLGGLLAPFGIEMHLRAAESDSDPGGKPGNKGSDEMGKRGSLGVSVGGHDDAVLQHVHDGGAAQKAGLSAGDVVIAVDGVKVGRGSLTRHVAERTPGTLVKLHAFRRDELHGFDVTLQTPERDTAYFTLTDKASPEMVARRKSWLGR